MRAAVLPRSELRAPPRGLEPRTCRVEADRSIQLSYGGVRHPLCRPPVTHRRSGRSWGMPTTILRAAVALALLAAVPAGAATDDPPQRTISVTGSANVTAANDTAGFTTGVDVRRASPSTALRAAAARMQHILDALTAQGIARNDIQTRRADVRRERR